MDIVPECQCLGGEARAHLSGEIHLLYFYLFNQQIEFRLGQQILKNSRKLATP